MQCLVGNAAFSASRSKCFFHHSSVILDCIKQQQESQSWDDKQSLKADLDRLEQGYRLDCAAYVNLLQKCGELKALEDGKRVHSLLSRHGYDRDRYFGNVLVQMYGNCGSLVDARLAFDRITRRNVYTWNMMIRAYTQNGQLQEARDMFDEMKKKDVVSWNVMISAYAQNGDVAQARVLFDVMPQRNVISWNALLTAYARSGDLEGTKKLFNKIPQYDVFSWNTMISAHLQNVHVGDAKELFDTVPQRTVVSWNAMISAYALNGLLDEARDMFEKTPQRNLVSWTAMITAHARNGSLGEARNVFNEMPQRDDVSWSTMVAAYAQNGHMQNARSLLDETPEASPRTWTVLITAYAQNGDLQEASRLFEMMPQPDLVAWTTMLAAFAQYGNLQEARNMFDRMPKRDSVSWTAMIGAYAQNGQVATAVELFRVMDLEGFYPDKITFISILDACVKEGLLAEGKMIHTAIIDIDLESDVAVGTALFNMYAKCGRLDEARQLFERLRRHDVVSWTAMIVAYAQNGQNIQAVELFQTMVLEGLQPNDITFVGILSVCSHAGKLDDGWHHFLSITRDYDIVLRAEHYVCMVDLLSRAGRLREAEELIQHMPFAPNEVAWISLLGACKTHNDAQRAARIAKECESDSKGPASSSYVLLSNMFAEAGGCASAKNLKEGRRVHLQLVEDGYDHSTHLGNLLVQMYGKCRSLEDACIAFGRILDKDVFSWNIMAAAYAQNGQLQEARDIFDRTPDKTVASWNTMITAYVRSGNMRDAKSLFNEMHERNEVSWNLMISACAQNGYLQDAKSMFDRIHQPAVSNWTSMISGYAKNGYLDEAKAMFDRMPEDDIIARTALISAYAQNGQLQEARRLFEETLSQQDVVSWTTMISAYVQSDQRNEAFLLFRRMDLDGIRPDKLTLINVLDACAQLSALALGKSVHSKVVEIGLETDVAVGTALLNMYGKCGDLDEVKNLFERVSPRDVVAWTAMISAFGGNGHVQDAQSTFDSMPQWNLVSWTAMITAYAEYGYLQEAVSMFHQMPQQDPVSVTAIVAAYAKNGYLEDARIMFESMPERDVVSWTAMIAAYSQNWLDKEAIQLFRKMDLEGMHPNKTTFLAILDACANLQDFEFGKTVHENIVGGGFESGLMVRSALVNMYGKCGSVADAKQVFDSMLEPDVVSRNAMVVAYAQNGYLHAAKSMFDSMTKRTLASWNAMVAAYVQNGYMPEARRMFEEMSERDVVTWTCMIGTYAQTGHPKEAFRLFRAMDLEGVQPNKVTFINMCAVCGDLASLAEANLIHVDIIDSGFRADAFLGTALVNMYGKCGSLDNARSLFDRKLRQYVESWNALLGSYSHNGQAKQVIGLFQQMILEGLQPLDSTFINLLSACSHAGLSDDGWRCFVAISGDHNAEPTADHYICMVDILARAGQLKNAEDLIRNMPFEPQALAWTSLLGACRENIDAERAGRAAEHVFELDPQNSAPYMLLSNLYKQPQEVKL